MTQAQCDSGGSGCPLRRFGSGSVWRCVWAKTIRTEETGSPERPNCEEVRVLMPRGVPRLGLLGPAWPRLASSGPARRWSRRTPALMTTWAGPGPLRAPSTAAAWPCASSALPSLPAFLSSSGPRPVLLLRPLPLGRRFFPFSLSSAALCPFPPFPARFGAPVSLTAFLTPLPPPPAPQAP